MIWYCTGRLMNQEMGHVGYNTNSGAKSGVPHRYHQHLRVLRAPGLEVSDLAASIPGLGTGWSGVEMSVSDPTTLHSAITGSLRAGFVLVMIDSGRRWHRTTRLCLPQWSFIRTVCHYRHRLCSSCFVAQLDSPELGSTRGQKSRLAISPSATS